MGPHSPEQKGGGDVVVAGYIFILEREGDTSYLFLSYGLVLDCVCTLICANYYTYLWTYRLDLLPAYNTYLSKHG